MRSRRFKVGILAALLALSLSAAVGCSSTVYDPVAEAIANGQPVITLHANGGEMGSSEKIQYILPEKGSYMPEPGKEYGSASGTVSIPTAKRSGYELTGWFRGTESADGTVTLGDAFDFATEKVTESRLTLYAGWNRKAYFNILYGDGKESKQVEPRSDGAFKAPTIRGYTVIGYYLDEELTQEITFDDRGYSTYKHPFGENPEVTVYTKWLKGSYTLVSEPSDLASIKVNTNLYLLNNIDMSGATTDAIGEYCGTIEGNGFTISNWTNERKTPGQETSFGLFTVLSGATLRNVTFENCNVISSVFVSNATAAKPHYLGFLAGSADSKTVFENVRLVNCTATYTKVRDAEAGLVHKGDVIADAECDLSSVTCENVTVTVTEKAKV